MSITKSSGNVFADIGHPHPEEALAKAQLLLCITTVINDHNLSLKEASRLLGIPRSKLSLLLDGHFSEFSIDTLTHYFEALNESIKETEHSTQMPAQPDVMHNEWGWRLHKIVQRVLQFYSFL